MRITETIEILGAETELLRSEVKKIAGILEQIGYSASWAIRKAG